jgi:hypothetical protein
MTTDELLPPDPKVSGNFVIGQDSPYKGVRLENAFYLPDRRSWRMGGFIYGGKELAAHHWEIVEAGELT